MKTNNKEKKKMNSYLKMLLWMAMGGAIGFVLAIGTLWQNENMAEIMINMVRWIGIHADTIMLALAIASVAIYIACYVRCEKLAKQMLEEPDDDRMDQLEKAYDRWGSVGMLICNEMTFVGMVLYAFTFQEEALGSGMNFLYITVVFIIALTAAAFFQIAFVKQMRRVHPDKRGDAADMNFEKEWMKSCDEGEKQLIYEASYRTVKTFKIILLFLLVAAMMGQLFFETGYTAIVLLGLSNVIMSAMYSINSMKAAKAGRHLANV